MADGMQPVWRRHGKYSQVMNWTHRTTAEHSTCHTLNTSGNLCTAQDTQHSNTLQPILHWQHHITVTSKQITWWTGAAEVVHKVMTCGPILARIWLAVIHIQLTVLSLEALGAVAWIWANQILARSTILTRCWLTLIDLILAVTASVAILTVTAVAVAYVLACAIVAQIVPGHTCTNQTVSTALNAHNSTNNTAQQFLTFAYCCITARNHLHVTHLACPARSTHTRVHVICLLAQCLVHARLSAAPVHIRVTLLARVAIWTVTRVVRDLVMTCSTVQARMTVTLIDAVLTVGAGVPAIYSVQNLGSNTSCSLCIT